MEESFIPLHRGLHSASMSMEAEPGGLAYARGWIYKPGSRALRKADGRARWDSGTPAIGAPIKGLGLLKTGSLTKLVIAANGKLFTTIPDATEVKLNEELTGYDADADWFFFQFGKVLFCCNGVDEPLAYNGASWERWGANPPITAPLAEGSGTNEAMPIATAAGYKYTYTFAKVVGTFRERESDPPIDTVAGDILYAEVTGPWEFYDQITVSGFEAKPSWATHVIIYRTTDGGATFLEIGSTTGSSFTDTTLSGAESPGDVVPTDHQVPPNDINTIFAFANKLGFTRKNEMGIWWSLAGQPHHFPYDIGKVDQGLVQRLEFQEAGSAVTWGALRCSKILTVGLDDGITFAERLPDDSDPQWVAAYSVRSGEIVGTVHSEDAFVGPRAWCQLALSSDEDAIFFVSKLGRGLTMTNGYQTAVVAPDFQFDENVINEDLLEQIVCVNNPRMWRIEIYCASPDSTYNDQMFHFYYHQTIRKRGTGGFPVGPCLGPFPRNVAHALMVPIGGKKLMCTGDSNAGALYLQSGLDEAAAAQSINLRTDWQTMGGRREGRILHVTPVFDGVGAYSFTLTVRAKTFQGSMNTVVTSFDGYQTADPGTDAYGDTDIPQPSPEIRPRFINLRAWASDFEVANAELGADLALLGFHMTYRPAGQAKATG